MKPNNRITYRFDVQGRVPAKDKPEMQRDAVRPAHRTEELSSADGQAPSFQNNVVPLYPQSAPNVMNEVQPWNNAFQEDISALEELIRGTDTGKKAKEEPGMDSPARLLEAEPDTDRPSWMTHAAPETERSARKSDAASETERPSVLSLDFSKHTTLGEGEQPWQAEYEESRRSAAIVPTVRRSGGKGPSWLQVFLSVGGALATGAIFGYLILTLFTGSTLWPSGESGGDGEKPAVVQPESKEPIGLHDLAGQKNGNKDGGKENGENTASNGADSGAGAGSGAGQGDQPAATVNVNDVSSSYTLLQFGVFSNTEGRDAALKQLKDGGLAAASTKTAEGYRVFAGIARDGSKAGIIVAGLPDVTLFKKEVAVQAPDKLPFAGKEEAAKAFFASTNELIGTWSDLVVAQLEQPSLSPLSASASEGWRARHEQWAAHASAMKEGISGVTGETYFTKLKTAIDTVAAAMTEYDKKTSKAHLWSAETALMEAVLSQKEWFESTSAL